MEEGYEKEVTEVLEDNNKLLFKPEFIPFYIAEVEKYHFNKTEGLLYGFIRFYLKNSPNGRFYFTNEQLAKILNTSEQTISNSLVKVCKCGEFKVSYKIKANGGTFRLIENYKSDYKKNYSPTIRKVIANKNKINKNNITISKDIGKPDTEKKQKTHSLKEKNKQKKKQEKKEGYGNKDINTCIEYFQKKLGASLDGSVQENRRYCYNLIRKMKKDYPDIEPTQQIKVLIDLAMQDKFHSKNATSFKYLFYNVQRIAQSFKSDYGIGDKSDIEEIT